MFLENITGTFQNYCFQVYMYVLSHACEQNVLYQQQPVLKKWKNRLCSKVAFMQDLNTGVKSFWRYSTSQMQHYTCPHKWTAIV